jgi:hypothetical protein
LETLDEVALVLNWGALLLLSLHMFSTHPFARRSEATNIHSSNFLEENWQTHSLSVSWVEEFCPLAKHVISLMRYAVDNRAVEFTACGFKHGVMWAKSCVIE